MAPKRARVEVATAAAALENDDDISADLSCPICHHLLVSPLRTPCGHAFCSFCLDRLFAVRRPADVRLQASERTRNCPMCRTPLRLADASLDAALDGQAARCFPRLHRQRGREIEQERERLAAQRLAHPTLCFGNSHSLRAPQGDSGNIHDWSFFVRLEGPEEEERYVEKVVVRLHPTFRPSTVTFTRPPFAVRRLGWGVFVIQAEVTLRPEWGHETLALQWMLDFDGEGSMRQVELELERRPAGSSGPAGGATAAEPAGPLGAGGGGTAPAAGAGSSGDEAEEGSDEEEEEESEDEPEEGSDDGNEFGERGGDYDLGRFVRAGWRDSPPTSDSEGEPAAVDFDAPDSADEGSDGE